MTQSEGERIARVEAEVSEINRRLDSMESKLDDLLAIRYKGAGAFWLATTLVGTGIIGLLAKFFHFFGGH
jgi:hypothetical protein